MARPHRLEKPQPGSLGESIANAMRFWEPRRLGYNFVLTTVTLAWLLGTWPHFRPAFTLASLLRLAILALLANVCYCAAYFVDIPLQYAASTALWSRWRSGLWWVGTLLATLFTNYWIADEIYPFVR